MSLSKCTFKRFLIFPLWYIRSRLPWKMVPHHLLSLRLLFFQAKPEYSDNAGGADEVYARESVCVMQSNSLTQKRMLSLNTLFPDMHEKVNLPRNAHWRNHNFLNFNISSCHLKSASSNIWGLKEISSTGKSSLYTSLRWKIQYAVFTQTLNISLRIERNGIKNHCTVLTFSIIYSLQNNIIT